MIFEKTLHQMILFFLILGVGFVAGKCHVVKKDFLGEFSGFIVTILLPVQLFYCTYASVTRDAVFDNLSMIVLAAAFYAVAIVLTWLLSKLLRLKGDRSRVFRLCFIFGNTGFVGIPLLAALFPEHGLLYMALFTLVDQPLLWTYGVYLSTAQHDAPGDSYGRHELNIDLKSLVSPNTVALVLAFACVLAAIPLPGIVMDTMQSISSATPALCMMYLGALLCFSDWMGALKRPDLYAGVAAKMIVLPVLAGKLLLWSGMFSQELIEALVIIIALPVMTLVPILAQKNGHEGDYAAGTTVATLVISIASIPLVVWLTFGT